MARMELPVLDKFCFILDLRTGCITMGIINSILTFVLAVLLITFAVDIKDVAELKKDDMDSMSSVVYTIVVMLVVLLFIKFIFDLVFVWAVYKERSGVIKKYCIFWIVFLVLSIIGFLKTLFHMSAAQVIQQIVFLDILRMMILRNCCFVVPLRLGCFIIGYIHMVFHIIQLVISIIILVSGVELSKLDIEFKEVANMLIARSAITMVFLLLFIAFAALLILGLYKNRRGYIKAFLIYATIFLVIYMILFFVSLGYGYIGAWNIVLGVLEIVFGAYFLLVIRSQYIAMGAGINRV